MNYMIRPPKYDRVEAKKRRQLKIPAFYRTLEEANAALKLLPKWHVIKIGMWL